MTPTTEQLAACALVKQNTHVKIDAGAGAAKTTTLTMIAAENAAPSLYLAYNKAMATEAAGKFPHWVTVKTTHSLAYAEFGRQMANKLKRPMGKYENVCGTGSEIARYFKIKDFLITEDEKITAAGIGLAIKETVNRFEYSADEQVSSKHISYSPVENRELNALKGAYDKVVLDHAKQLWTLRTNLKSNILANHDTYLKLYQLSKPSLSSYDIIYLDEAQDTNDCVLDIIRGLKDQKVVIVGDKYQQIYGWRGSVNAMEKLNFESTRLTQSFRFGQEVANIANAIIGDGFDMKGWDKLNTRVVPKDQFMREHDGCGVHTTLYRTNAALLVDAVSYIAQGKKVNLEIDVKDFMKMLDSAVELYRGNLPKVKHEDLLQFDSWSSLVAEAEVVKGELKRVVDVVLSGDVFRIIGILSTQHNVDNPDLTMTTAHKSKGREWDIVVLADDFPSPYNRNGEWVGLSDMERNLLYVASTRAKKVLAYNESVEDFIERAWLSGDAKAKCYVDVENVVVMSGEDFIHKHDVMLDAVVGECARLGVISTKDEIESAMYMEEHFLKFGTYSEMDQDY